MTSLRLRAVLYREDGLWVAYALEMDLIGTGATESVALRELRGNVEAQLSFAAQEEINPFRPAPPEIQALWEETNLAALGMGRAKSKAITKTTRFMEWNDAQVSRILLICDFLEGPFRGLLRGKFQPSSPLSGIPIISA